jgi:hypothetical protein
VLPLLPANTRQGWRTLLENRSVTDFRTGTPNIDPARVDGDNATVHFTFPVSFRNLNQNVDQTLRFDGSAQKTSSGWKLTSLRTATN